MAEEGKGKKVKGKDPVDNRAAWPHGRIAAHLISTDSVWSRILMA